jgi:hypothetical protein
MGNGDMDSSNPTHKQYIRVRHSLSHDWTLLAAHSFKSCRTGSSVEFLHRPKKRTLLCIQSSALCFAVVFLDA